MATNGKPPVLVVVQLTGGNDFMNTIVPYTNPIYYDSRKKVVIPEDEVLPLNDSLGFHPSLGPFKELYDRGNVAIVQGIGYPNSSRSHFRGMDIWHTCEPDRVGNEGWLGKAIRDLDPNTKNVLTGVNFGRGLPRALSLTGVPVASVGDLDNYGVMTSISEDERNELLDSFKRMYGPAIGTGPVMDYLKQTGVDVMKGADRLKDAPASYSSEVEYAGQPDREEPEGHRTRASGRRGNPHLLHDSRWLRHPLQRDAYPARAAVGHVGRDHGLLPRPPGPPGLGRSRHAGVHRVRQEDAGQRQRHRSRLRRWRLHHRRPG